MPIDHDPQAVEILLAFFKEIKHITKMTRIADIGGAAVVEATAVGIPEHEVALHSTQAMVREMAW